MILSIIVAVAKNGAIGKNNRLLWHLPSDLKRFKETTTGHAILMGKNTFLSLPKGALPNRRNIVISKTLPPQHKIEVYKNEEEALLAVKEEQEVFIIGGAQIYHTFLPLCDRIYYTRIEATFPEADTFFPKMNWEEWELVSEKSFEADEKNEYNSRLSIYERKKD